MRRILPVAALIIAVFAINGDALARNKQNDENVVNFGNATCTEFAEAMKDASQDDVAGVMLWLDGYATALNGESALDWNRFQKFTQGVANYCQNRPNARLMDAVKRNH